MYSHTQRSLKVTKGSGFGPKKRDLDLEGRCWDQQEPNSCFAFACVFWLCFKHQVLLTFSVPNPIFFVLFCFCWSKTGFSTVGVIAHPCGTWRASWWKRHKEVLFPLCRNPLQEWGQLLSPQGTLALHLWAKLPKPRWTRTPEIYRNLFCRRSQTLGSWEGGGWAVPATCVSCWWLDMGIKK